MLLELSTESVALLVHSLRTPKVTHHAVSIDPYETFEKVHPISAEKLHLADVLEQLVLERDNADRLAGEALRKLEDAKQSIKARQSWLSKAKKQWGVGDNVSFDYVWEEALALKGTLISRHVQSSGRSNV